MFVRVGIIRSSSIGDVVLATACLKVLETANLCAEVVWLGRQPGLKLIESSFPRIKCVDLDAYSSTGELVAKLSPLDIIVDAQGNLRARKIVWALKKRDNLVAVTSSKIQLRRNWLLVEGQLIGRKRRHLPAASRLSQYPQYALMAKAMHLALQELGVEENAGPSKLDASRPFLNVSSSERPQLLKPEANWLAIAPGASHLTKRAPLEVFERIVASFGVLYPKGRRLGILLVGDESERSLCDSLQSTINWPRGSVLNVAGKLCLSETSRYLSWVHYLLSNDSCLAHIAEAVKTPVGVLFGPTIEGFGFAPHLPSSQAFSVDLGCRPCSKHGRRSCRFGDLKCFKGIDCKEIASHMALVIENTFNKRPCL